MQLPSVQLFFALHFFCFFFFVSSVSFSRTAGGSGAGFPFSKFSSSSCFFFHRGTAGGSGAAGLPGHHHHDAARYGTDYRMCSLIECALL